MALKRIHPWPAAVFLGGLAWAAFLTQGLPYWDVDYVQGFQPLAGKTLGQVAWEWAAPISTDAQNWGFLDRAAQSFAYKVSYLIAGYDPWPYTLFRNLCLAGLGVMIYLWVRLLLGRTPRSRMAGAAAAAFFLLAPGASASNVWLGDFAPVSEFLAASLLYLLWKAMERRPTALEWAGLTLAVYLAYKTKGDVKLIPAILAAYTLAARRTEWKRFAVPIAAMALLAVPWSSVFIKVPPFLPGAEGSETGWMWQPASLERLSAFLWSADPFDWSFQKGALSLTALLAPFLLPGMALALLWLRDASPRVRWRSLDAPEERARLMVALWFAAMLAGASALPAINYFFRIRYSILLFGPASILAGWLLGLLIERWESAPKWLVVTAALLFVAQTAANASRSLYHRRDLGRIMVAVDKAYARIDSAYPRERLALLGSFLHYAYRPGAALPILRPDHADGDAELAALYGTHSALALSWEAYLSERLDLLERFSGCNPGVLFDRLFPCEPGSGAALMRYVGLDDGLVRAGEARERGDAAAARAAYEEFLRRRPGNLGARFWLGVAAYQQKDWAAAEAANRELESQLPGSIPALYNHAVALMELKRYDEAIARLERVVASGPQNYGAQLNLYWSYRRAGRAEKAREAIERMQNLFPTDETVSKLAADVAGR